MSWTLPFFNRDNSTRPLHTEVYGAGETTLVFVAGLGGTTRYWRNRIRSLEPHYRIVLVDLLGFGQSPKPWTQYSVDRHVSELRAVLAPFESVSMIGHSLGALLTIAYAARFPDQIKNIIVIAMPYFGSQASAYRYFRNGPVNGGVFYTNIFLTMLACVITRRVLGWLLPHVLRRVPREVAEDLVKHTWRSSTSSLWEVVYRYDIAADLARLRHEIGVMFIHGDQDLMAPVDSVERLAAKDSTWRLAVMPGVDHHPFLRDPSACLTLIDAMVSPAGAGATATHPAISLTEKGE